MLEDNAHLLEALNVISPADLTYTEWASVGMALKHEGFDVSVWDDWSRNDSRYKHGECQRKWHSFGERTSPIVTGGTIVQMAKERGWVPGGMGEEIGWDDYISNEKDDYVVVKAGYLDGKDLPAPLGTPVNQLTTYLSTLFSSSDIVGYVTDCYEAEGRTMPKKGNFDRTAGELIEALDKCNGDIGMVLGDTDPNAGAWIRFNPLDGQGVRNDNVTAFNYALVESDKIPVDKQYSIYTDLELPIACLVHSGGKSLHAIVRVDASSYGEYQRRVDFLYEVLKRNHLEPDRQNRNPSRLSRMPGILRNGRQQSLLAVNVGKKDWAEWREWIEAINDDLPDAENLSSVWNNPPDLSPPLIEGILRQGHKMLLAGPSKAGKSFALIELSIAIAEGIRWIGFQCTQGNVLYVNLELDRASCFHRFRDVYQTIGLPPRNIGSIDIWNLRGKSVPMDKLAPKLIRRAGKKQYAAVIIDPIYKVITGDENSADQMAAFCNQFDKVCNELGCAVIYCHHHSKGAQGGKRSMDRASGSGVFARDPDALLDMIELELSVDVVKTRKNAAACAVCEKYLKRYQFDDKVSQDDLQSRVKSIDACQKYLPSVAMPDFNRDVAAADGKVDSTTGWRIEGTLREFPSFKPVNAWFEYPIHKMDDTGVLADIQPEVAAPAWTKNLSKSGKRKKTDAERKAERVAAIENAFRFSLEDGANTVSLSALMDYTGSSEDTVRRHLKEAKKFWIEDCVVGLKS